jgi:hypothetical protein
LEHADSGKINFCTGLWDGENFLLWRIEDNPDRKSCLLPSWYRVTHWAWSEATNKTWFTYQWDDLRLYCYINAPPDGRIL